MEKTKCCNTKHYTLNENTAICTNEGCAHYLTITTLVRPKRTKQFLTAAWLLVFLVAFTTCDFSSVNSKVIPIQQRKLMHELRPVLTAQALRSEIEDLEIVCPEEVYAQMMLESGNLTSFLTRNTNNMLGMRYPFRRTTTASGIFLPDQDTTIYGDAATLKKYAKLNNYAVYATWQDAVKDYKYWQDEYFCLGDRYLQFLGNIYAEDSSYEAKIRTVMKRESN
jgi:hypothetical protein